MNNQIIIVGILSVALLIPNIHMEFWALAIPNPFSQQVIFGSIAKDHIASAQHTKDNKITDYNIVPVSTPTVANDTIARASRNTDQTLPMISVVDVTNSTYIVPKEIDDDDSERRISRAIRERINDILHTLVRGNATIIISNSTIANSFVNFSTTVNNHTRLIELIPDHMEIALAGIRASSQPADPTIEIHTDIETVCDANNRTLAECDINIRIR
jgi:hypothetical protein